ncbi:hypothetical protein [Paraliobacillus sp. X-1268]|uniref:hypothetical protein n=1 Tax=Paraliobacillus sp. X-1268 TaxID=2213193 RepID=UPI000E3DFC9D|nr:hypothetical protein [Paraliobacillus sp. X-1268]
MSTYSNGYLGLLDKMDDLFPDLFSWLAKQYDPSTGGFYYARSSKTIDGLIPDIESTAQGLNILIRNNLLDSLSEDMKEQMIVFFQKKQDSKTGYFFDDNRAMRNDEVMVHRAISYATGSLKNLGAGPLYPLPMDQDTAPAYVKTTASYLEKWKSIDLRNSWRGCDLFANSCVYIRELKEEQQQVYLNQAVSYLKSIQDKQTGLWGQGSLYVRISGTFKLLTFYNKFRLKMPNPECIYQSILQCLRTEEAEDMCYIRNPINLLSYLDIAIPPPDLKEIIEITNNNMKKFKKKDGGFSREIVCSPSAPNVAQVKSGEYYPDMPDPVHLGLGLEEGDMNATTQATLIRLQLYQLCKKEILPLPEVSEFHHYLSKY